MPEQPAPLRLIADRDALILHLEELRVEGTDSAALLEPGPTGSLWFAFCTDPDGEWFAESGSPSDRVEENEAGDAVYTPLAVGSMRYLHFPLLVLDQRAADGLIAVAERAARSAE